MQIRAASVKVHHADRVLAVRSSQSFSRHLSSSSLTNTWAVAVRSGFVATARPSITAAVTAQQGGGQLCKPAPLASTHAQGSILWGGSQHVQHVGVEDVEALYVSLSQRTNEQNVLLVLYAPWCQHCQNIVPEVEKLAAGLAHESSLSVVALCTDPPAARYFCTNVLGINALPSFVLFPKGSRTFFKYKGRAHDAQALLKFLNMVCNQQQDAVWQLKGAAAATTSSTASRLPATTSKPAADPKVPAPALLIGMVGIAALVYKLTNRPAESGTQKQEQQNDDDSSGDVITPKRLLRQIDQVMCRMGSLMWKLAGARVSVTIMASQVAALERQAAITPPAVAPNSVPKPLPEGSEAVAEVAVDKPLDAKLGTKGTATADAEAAEPQVPQATAALHADAPQHAAADVNHATGSHAGQTDSGVVAAATTSPASLPGPPQQPVKTASQQPTTVTANNVVPYNAGITISSAEVLKLLDEEGDVDKVVEQLLAKNITLQDLPTKIDSKSLNL